MGPRNEPLKPTDPRADGIQREYAKGGRLPVSVLAGVESGGAHTTAICGYVCPDVCTNLGSDFGGAHGCHHWVERLGRQVGSAFRHSPSFMPVYTSFADLARGDDGTQILAESFVCMNLQVHHGGEARQAIDVGQAGLSVTRSFSTVVRLDSPSTLVSTALSVTRFPRFR